MLQVTTTVTYRKAYKRLLYSGNFPVEEVVSIVDTLASGRALHPKYRDHALHGEYLGFRECHIRGNLLLVYKIKDNNTTLLLYDIGSHSEVFE